MVRVASLIHQVHGHKVEARSTEQLFVADNSPVDWDNLPACKSCGVRFGKDEHDPCIANLPGTRNACCGHGLPDEETCRPMVGLDDNGKLISLGTSKKVMSWGYVELTDGRRIEFPGTAGGERIHQAVDAALNQLPLPDEFRYA